MGRKLDPPTLNISAAYFYDPTLFGSAPTFERQDQKKMLWMWGNDTYDYDYVSQQGMCQSSGVCSPLYSTVVTLHLLGTRETTNGDFLSCCYSR